MKILVIGGTGLVGSYLLPRLVEKDNDVFALTRTKDKIERINKIGAFGLLGDIRNPQTFKSNLPDKLDIIVLLAMPSLKPGHRMTKKRKEELGAFIMYSSAVKRLAVKISKICNDLRLLSSGPRCGLNEINLPPMQPGSSIMPGKVNPVIPEVMNQIAFKVIGNDLSVTLAVEAGQLELNVMEPVIIQSLLDSIEMLKNGMETLTHRCIKGITANEARCREMVENSIGLVTAL